MTGFADFLSQDRRLAILRLLVEARGSCGESVLEKGLWALGHRVGVDRDAVRADLRFLETAGCVEIEFFQDKVMVATLTRRGEACAKGNITVDGVAEPAIGR
jgi:predicted ArsR family transcriptional regulator